MKNNKDKFNNLLLKYPVTDRTDFQEAFDNLLDCGFDIYGYVENEDLEKAYGKIKESEFFISDLSATVSEPEARPHLHYFDNGVFMLNPYYWGDAEDLIEFPNFIYYPENIIISWYKYPLRGAYSNINLSLEKLREIINACIRSLTHKAGRDNADIEVQTLQDVPDNELIKKLKDYGFENGYDNTYISIVVELEKRLKNQ